MTTAVIWIRKQDGEFKGLHISGDGYPDNIGRHLLECKDDAEAEEKLYDSDFDDMVDYGNIKPDEGICDLADYNYLFKNGEWHVYRKDPTKMVTVNDALEMEDE